MQIIEGQFVSPAGRYALVASRFNAFIVERLVEAAADGLRRHGVDDEDIVLVRVPGAHELPLAAERLAASGEYAAIIALGCVIRGATYHFEIVAGESAKGLFQVSMDHGLPVINAVLTTDTIDQAIERAGTKAGNKGYDAALAAIEMVSLLQQLPR